MGYPQGKLIYQYQSPFQTIEVSQGDNLRLLRTDERSIQSAMSLNHPEQLMLPYTQAMMAPLLFQAPPRTALLLGLGGGDLVRYLHHHLPQMTIDAVEIDAEMVRVCRDWFALPQSDKITVEVDDGMNYLNHNQHRYDWLLVDIYQGRKVPPPLQSRAFYRRCFESLNNDGVLVLNLLTDDAEIFRNILWLIRQQFDRTTLCITIPQNINILVFAFRKRPLKLSKLALLTVAEQLSERFELDFSKLVHNLFSTNPTVGGELIFEK